MHSSSGALINPRQEKNIHDILPDEVEEFDAIIQKTRKKLEIEVEPAIHALHEYTHPHPPRHRRGKLQCQKKAERDPQH